MAYDGNVLEGHADRANRFGYSDVSPRKARKYNTGLYARDVLRLVEKGKTFFEAVDEIVLKERVDERDHNYVRTQIAKSLDLVVCIISTEQYRD